MEFNNDRDFFGCIYDSIEKDYKYRWEVWIKKLIQFKILEDFLDIIPNPKDENAMLKPE